MNQEQKTPEEIAREIIDEHGRGPVSWSSLIIEAITAERSRADRMLKEQHAIQSGLVKDIQHYKHVAEDVEQSEKRISEQVSEIAGLVRKNEELLEGIKVAVEALEEFATHGDDCILSQQHGGRVKPDGGYECLFGYGKDEKWYDSKDIPKCACGLDESLTTINSLVDRMK